MSYRHFLACALISLASVTVAASVAMPAVAQQPSVSGSNWSRVQALPPHTKVHITTDHSGKTCRIFAVSDDALTCSKAGNKAGDVLPRAAIQHIKLTHVVRSTLVGAGIGAGAGAISGGIAGRTKPCPAGNGFCLNGIGIGAGGVAAIFGVVGAVLGSVVGGTTDLARGSAIYTRP